MLTKQIKVYAISNIGNVRDNHEDNLFIPTNKYIDEKKQKEIKNSNNNIEFEYDGSNGIFAVCDGMGGHNAGEMASRLAVEAISNKYNDILVKDKNGLINFIKDLNKFICDYSEKHIECNNMGTTFSAIIIENEKIYLLHIGDSRIYKIENGKLIQISKDHTEGVRLVEAGIVKKENLYKMPNRKSLYKYLGRNGELVADCEEIEVLPNMQFIVSSDGLSDTLNDEEISDVVLKSDSPKEVVNNLLKACLAKGDLCTDNVTIISINIENN